MSEVVIASAARTPVGAFSGGLSTVPASYLGSVAISEAMKRATVDPGEVDEVIMGQILTAGTGQNPARQAAIDAGIPVEKTAYQINQLCGSGLRTVALGYQSILTGDCDVVVAGGQESMSMSPHCAHLRNGQKMGDLSFVDTMLKDGLFDAFNGYHMGNTAENVARQWQLTPRRSGRPLPPHRSKRPKRRWPPASSWTKSFRSRSRDDAVIRSSTPTSIPSPARPLKRWAGCGRPLKRTVR